MLSKLIEQDLSQTQQEWMKEFSELSIEEKKEWRIKIQEYHALVLETCKLLRDITENELELRNNYNMAYWSKMKKPKEVPPNRAFTYKVALLFLRTGQIQYEKVKETKQEKGIEQDKEVEQEKEIEKVVEFKKPTAPVLDVSSLAERNKKTIENLQKSRMPQVQEKVPHIDVKIAPSAARTREQRLELFSEACTDFYSKILEELEPEGVLWFILPENAQKEIPSWLKGLAINHLIKLLDKRTEPLSSVKNKSTFIQKPVHTRKELAKVFNIPESKFHTLVDKKHKRVFVREIKKACDLYRTEKDKDTVIEHRRAEKEKSRKKELNEKEGKVSVEIELQKEAFSVWEMYIKNVPEDYRAELVLPKNILLFASAQAERELYRIKQLAGANSTKRAKLLQSLGLEDHAGDFNLLVMDYPSYISYKKSTDLTEPKILALKQLFVDVENEIRRFKSEKED